MAPYGRRRATRMARGDIAAKVNTVATAGSAEPFGVATPAAMEEFSEGLCNFGVANNAHPPCCNPACLTSKAGAGELQRRARWTEKKSKTARSSALVSRGQFGDGRIAIVTLHENILVMAILAVTHGPLRFGCTRAAPKSKTPAATTERHPLTFAF